MLTTRVSTKRL